MNAAAPAMMSPQPAPRPTAAARQNPVEQPAGSRVRPYGEL
ncbi:MAG: hypothetical protein OXU61_01630 [Gammaproteobacteria bacterium]|nr:hypothetical protein [Gammaproteobacteria bacterium]